VADASLSQAPVDAAQERVVTAAATAGLVVTAGPGTGKTRTLLARARHLVEQEGLEPAEDLMLLSFSRAAVETVAERGFTETGLGRLPVSTVDSLASRILFETGTPMVGRSFDERIGQAIEVLAEDPPGLDGLLTARQLLVDEAQDMVGIRARFVLALLDYLCARGDAGFTVLGDAAQAIYDFQAEAEKETARLLDLLGDSFPQAEWIELTTNHRMRNPRLVGLAATYGPRLRAEDGVDWTKLRHEIAEEIRIEQGWLRPDDAPSEVRTVVEGPGQPTVAVLTRTNVEALRMASKLQAGGLAVVFRHRALDRGGAPWLATLFGEEEFAEVPLADLLVPREGLAPWFYPPSDPGRPLREAGVARQGRVDLRRLAALLRAGACPESLVVQRRGAVSVSTVHQAKGLEFDTVFVVENDLRSEEACPEEARVLYVAATRARDELLWGAPLKQLGKSMPTEGRARAGVGSWQGRGPAQYVEVKVSDSDPEWAPSGRAEFDRVQALLVDQVTPGTRAELRLADEGSGGELLYDIVDPESGVTVGRTTAALGAVLRRRRRQPPETITGLMADIPDTAAFGSATARRLGLGEHGIHLRARVYGLAWVGS
jgi:ATP-dependent DNA helicase UvrD/PcrA